MNLLDWATGGQPIQTQNEFDVQLDNSVYIGITFLIVGILFAIVFFFFIKSLS